MMVPQASSSAAATGLVEVIGVDESVGMQGCTSMTVPSLAMNRSRPAALSHSVVTWIRPGARQRLQVKRPPSGSGRHVDSADPVPFETHCLVRDIDDELVASGQVKQCQIRLLERDALAARGLPRWPAPKRQPHQRRNPANSLIFMGRLLSEQDYIKAPAGSPGRDKNWKSAEPLCPSTRRTRNSRQLFLTRSSW